MSQDTLHPTPALSVVAREQLRFVGGVLRRDAAVLLLIALIPSILPVSVQAPDRIGPIPSTFTPWSVSIAVVLACLTAALLWKGDEPSRRGYDSVMPLDPLTHALLRVASGWIWMLGIVAVYLLWSFLMAWLTGVEIGVDRFVVSSSRSRVGDVPSSVMDLQWAVPVWQWFTIFTGASTAYLLTSIAALRSDHPGRWIGGIVAVLLAIWFFGGVYDVDGAANIFAELFGGRYGLSAAFVGAQATWETLEWVGPTGSANLSATAMKPTLGAWLVAMPLWLGVSLIGTLLAARPRR